MQAWPLEICLSRSPIFLLQRPRVHKNRVTERPGVVVTIARPGGSKALRPGFHQRRKRRGRCEEAGVSL
jgi:hypothetical protein